MNNLEIDQIFRKQKDEIKNKRAVKIQKRKLAKLQKEAEEKRLLGEIEAKILILKETAGYLFQKKGTTFYKFVLFALEKRKGEKLGIKILKITHENEFRHTFEVRVAKPKEEQEEVCGQLIVKTLGFNARIHPTEELLQRLTEISTTEGFVAKFLKCNKGLIV